MKVLVVEDDKMIADLVVQGLGKQGFAVDQVNNGKSALSAVQSEDYDLVLLDLGLPVMDGKQTLKQLQLSHKNLPVIIMTAQDALDDRVAGLDAGADDYITKPFEMIELMARMRAVLRRSSESKGVVLSNGALSLDTTTKTAAVAGGEQVQLSAKEYALLHCLMMRPGVILSRSELEQKIYGWDEMVESNTVDFLIHSVRKKLGRDLVRNIRGLGWMVDR